MLCAVVHLLQTSSLSLIDKTIIMLYLALCLVGILTLFVAVVFASIKIRKLKKLVAKYRTKDCLYFVP